MSYDSRKAGHYLAPSAEASPSEEERKSKNGLTAKKIDLDYLLAVRHTVTACGPDVSQGTLRSAVRSGLKQETQFVRTGNFCPWGRGGSHE